MAPPRTAKAKKEIDPVAVGKKKTLENKSKNVQGFSDEDMQVIELVDTIKKLEDPVEIKYGKKEVSSKGRGKKPKQNILEPVVEVTNNSEVNAVIDAESLNQKAQNKAAIKGMGRKKEDSEKIGKDVKVSKIENADGKVAKDMIDEKENSKTPLLRESRRQKITALTNPIVENVMDIAENELTKIKANKALKKPLSKSRSKKQTKVTNNKVMDTEENQVLNIVPNDLKQADDHKKTRPEETALPLNKSNTSSEYTRKEEKKVSKGRGKTTKALVNSENLAVKVTFQDAEDRLDNMAEKPKSKNREKKVLKKIVTGFLINTVDGLSHENEKALVIEKRTEKKHEIKLSRSKKHSNLKTNNEGSSSQESVPEKEDIETEIEEISSISQPKQTTGNKRTAPKRTKGKQSDNKESHSAEEPPNKKKKETEKKPPLKNKSVTVYEDIDFSNTSKNDQGQPWNLKICSWNVDGIRAWLNKGGLDYIEHEKPDILCLQEVKCSQDKLPAEAATIPGYHPYWLCSEDKDGYAGVGIYTTKMAIHVQYGLEDEELDGEGRIITAEYEQFYLICTYVPNAGRKLVTLPKRLKWNEIFQQYVKKLDEKKPVIICGDMNVAHNEIDLANPKSNKKNAGFTAEEREGMTSLLNCGFVDTFRHLYPEQTGAYTFWTYMSNSRAKNVGWRLDYMLVSERLLPTVCDSVIRSQVFGSDHCPITLFLHLSSVPKIPSE